VTDTRQATGYANYNGDVRPGLDMKRAMGPNYMGELMWPVTASYDPETNKTKVGFSLMPPPPEDTTE